MLYVIGYPAYIRETMPRGSGIYYWECLWSRGSGHSFEMRSGVALLALHALDPLHWSLEV